MISHPLPLFNRKMQPTEQERIIINDWELGLTAKESSIKRGLTKYQVEGLRQRIRAKGLRVMIPRKGYVIIV